MDHTNTHTTLSRVEGLVHQKLDDEYLERAHGHVKGPSVWGRPPEQLPDTLEVGLMGEQGVMPRGSDDREGAGEC